MKQRRFDFVGRFDGITRTPQGGIKATANLTRVGVFTYYNADGSESLELRHPNDIFKKESLDTLKLAPITIGHPAGTVTPGNYRDLAVGTVSTDVRRNDRFVTATVYIQDADAVARVEKGLQNPDDPDALVEVSLGYEVEVTPDSGTFDGEIFNSRQTGHVYNHAALGPKNWGRAGNDVRILLDDGGHVPTETYAAPPREDDRNATIERLTRELAHARADASVARGERDAARADAAREKTRADAADAKTKITDSPEFVALVAARSKLEQTAYAVLGADFTPVVSGGKPKTDAAIMLEVVGRVDPELRLDGDSPSYLRGMFDSCVRRANLADAAVANLVRGITVTGPPELSRIDAARKRADNAARAAYVNAAPACATAVRQGAAQVAR